MNADMKRRLDRIADKLSTSNDKSGIVFIPLEGESECQYGERIQRWYAGEKVDGQEKLYTDPNQPLMRVLFVDNERKFSIRGAS